MNKIVLFIQGGGEGGYEADAKLVASLQEALGEGYAVRYPELLSDETLSDFGWPQQIGKEIERIRDGGFLVGHSFVAQIFWHTFQSKSWPARCKPLQKTAN